MQLELEACSDWALILMRFSWSNKSAHQNLCVQPKPRKFRDSGWLNFLCYYLNEWNNNTCAAWVSLKCFMRWCDISIVCLWTRPLVCRIWCNFLWLATIRSCNEEALYLYSFAIRTERCRILALHSLYWVEAWTAFDFKSRMTFAAFDEINLYWFINSTFSVLARDLSESSCFWK